MRKDITLGSFFPGDTPVHHLDPRTKIFLTLFYIITVLKAGGPISFGLTFLWLFLALYCAKISFRVIFQGLQGFIFIMVLVVLINVFFTPGETLLQWRFFTVTDTGLKTAFWWLVRIIMLIAGAAWLTYTTSPLQLMTGLEYLLRPCRIIGLNSHELAIMMIIALRFIPLLLLETQRIIQAQQSRGADFSGNIFRKIRSVLPILAPLLASVWQHGEELAEAMESRCYRGGEGRSSLHVLTMSVYDWGVLSAGAAALLVVAMLQF